MSVNWSDPNSVAEYAWAVESERDELKSRLEKLEASLATQGKQTAYPELKPDYWNDPSLDVAQKIAVAEARGDWARASAYKDDLVRQQAGMMNRVEDESHRIPGIPEAPKEAPLEDQIRAAEAAGDWARSGLLKDALLKRQAEAMMAAVASSPPQPGEVHESLRHATQGPA